jgi:hypothetical protein
MGFSSGVAEQREAPQRGLHVLAGIMQAVGDVDRAAG